MKEFCRQRLALVQRNNVSFCSVCVKPNETVILIAAVSEQSPELSTSLRKREREKGELWVHSTTAKWVHSGKVGWWCVCCECFDWHLTVEGTDWSQRRRPDCDVMLLRRCYVSSNGDVVPLPQDDKESLNHLFEEHLLTDVILHQVSFCQSSCLELYSPAQWRLQMNALHSLSS